MARTRPPGSRDNLQTYYENRFFDIFENFRSRNFEIFKNPGFLPKWTPPPVGPGHPDGLVQFRDSRLPDSESMVLGLLWELWGRAARGGSARKSCEQLGAAMVTQIELSLF